MKTGEKEKEVIMMQELKKMIDEILEKGYIIKTGDFRPFEGNYAMAFANKADSLKHFLTDIVIYKEDTLYATYEYILNKYNAMLQLESMLDGTYFPKETVELVDYINSKSK